MNSRVENKRLLRWPANRSEAVAELVSETDGFLVSAAKSDIVEYITKYGDDTTLFYCPETDDCRRLVDSVYIDTVAEDLVDPSGLARFVWNCVDVNCIPHIGGFVLVSMENNALKDRIDERTGNSLTSKVIDRVLSEGIVSEQEPHSGYIVININAMKASAIESANRLDISFSKAFQDMFIADILVETRRAIYQHGEVLTPIGAEGYDIDGGDANKLITYAAEQYERLMNNNEASRMIKQMLFPKIRELEKERVMYRERNDKEEEPER